MAAVVHPGIHDRRTSERRRPDLRLVPPDGCRQPRPAVRSLSLGVYTRRRIVAVLALVAVLVAGRFLIGSLAASAQVRPLTPDPVAARTYVVQPGDTLWSIARALHPSGDVRVVVQRLIAARGTERVVAGERISLP